MKTDTLLRVLSTLFLIAVAIIVLHNVTDSVMEEEWDRATFWALIMIGMSLGRIGMLLERSRRAEG